MTIPDSRIFTIASDDISLFGCLQSRLHELWSLANASSHGVGNDPTYNGQSCFEAFPFPFLSDAQRGAIDEAASNLDQLRTRWLNPPEWVVEDVLEFPASVDGPWARLVQNPNAEGIGTARYVRLLPKDDDIAKQLKKRTLTNLYNERPAWLDQAHRRLDEAVFAAYGWSPDLSDEELLAKLLELNLARAAEEGEAAPATLPDEDADDDDD